MPTFKVYQYVQTLCEFSVEAPTMADAIVRVQRSQEDGHVQHDYDEVMFDIGMPIDNLDPETRTALSEYEERDGITALNESLGIVESIARIEMGGDE